MLLQENQLMLKELKTNKQALRKFCKTGTFSYSDPNGSFLGEAAIINDTTLISFVQDSADASKISATEAFKNGYTLVFNQSGEDFSRFRFGKPPYNGELGGFASSKVYLVSLDSLKSDIATIMQCCQQAKESYPLTSAFNKLFAGNKMSIQDVDSLLNQTIDNLNKVIAKQRRQNISPSFDPNKVPEGPSTHHDHSTSRSRPIQDIAK